MPNLPEAVTQRHDLARPNLQAAGSLTSSGGAARRRAEWPTSHFLRGIQCHRPISRSSQAAERRTAVLRTRRVVFGGRETEPTKHLGEAMTLVLIETREELRGSWWVTDDREAAEHADRKGITTRDTMHIMGELVSEGTLTAVDAFALMQTMRDRDRHMRMPDSPRDLQ